MALFFWHGRAILTSEGKAFKVDGRSAVKLVTVAIYLQGGVSLPMFDWAYTCKPRASCPYQGAFVCPCKAFQI